MGSLKNSKQLNIFLLLALVSIPMVSVLLLSTTVVAEIHFMSNPKFLFFLIASCVVYMNICILYLYVVLRRYYKTLQETTTEKIVYESELNFLKQLKYSQKKLYAMKHDLKNQYIVLFGMLNQGDISGAKQYLENSIQQIEHLDYFYTNNYVLNYFLNEKKSIAEGNGISLEIKSFISEKISLDTDVLAIVLGNLIDNALNAVLRLKDIEEKDISLLIKQFDGNLLIEISNTFDTFELKTRRHRQVEGIGIKNIKKVIEENGGLYNQWSEHNRYIVSILLLDVYNNPS